MTRAIIYIPPTGYEQSGARCLDYVRDRGYEFKGIVRDWAAVHRMLGAGEVTVAVVADERDLDPQRKPRVEYVSHAANGGKHWDERTRLIQRPVAGE